MATNDAQKNNIKQRQDIVLGASLAIVAGFLVNVLSGVFYDMFITKTLSFAEISQFVLLMLFFLIILFEGFLEFLIYDVLQGEDADINKRFWLRYFDFLDKKHWAHKTAQFTMRSVWIFIKWLIWVSFFFSIIATKGWFLLIIFICGTFVYQAVKVGMFRNKKKES